MDTEDWIKQIKKQFEAKHLPEIQDYLRIPSISATGEGIQETAEKTANTLTDLGANNIQIVPTKGWPVVYGELIQDPQKPTVLFYSMYDVQPVEPEKWIVPPFQGSVVENFEGMGRALVARGVINTKGPTMAFFQTVKALVDSGTQPPVNLIFAIEGEEELGSLHFPEFVNSFSEQLKQADLVFFPSFSESLSGRIRIVLGCRGIIYFKIGMRGGDWGGPKSRNIHSSLASFVDSPTWRLVNLISKMRASDGKILIPGIYEKVLPMAEGDLQIMLELARNFDVEEFKEILDVDLFYLNENKEERNIEQILFELFKPCLTIDGIISGYTEEIGSKTVLPCSAFANMDIRLVPDMEVEDTRTKIINFIKANAPEAQLEIEKGYKWAKTSPDHPYIKTHLDLLKSTGKEVQIWPMSTGSAPFYIFQEKFNIPFINGGLGHGSRAHSPNEYAFLESKTGAGGIMDFEISVAKLLSKLGELGKLKRKP
ncbi:MAG: M20/M25/M40 family metallo-hydrolase [Promethearchaeota archaeon]|jgi:acetylornithine deacetylase/succinyl-diaminopimelate desuccinylase-like protein